MGQTLGLYKVLSQRGDLYARLVDIAVDPIARGLIGGKAGDALDLFLGAAVGREAGGKGIETVVAGQPPDGLGAEVQFGNSGLVPRGMRSSVEHGGGELVQHVGIGADKFVETQITAEMIGAASMGVGGFLGQIGIAEDGWNVIKQELVRIVGKLGEIADLNGRSRRGGRFSGSRV